METTMTKEETIHDLVKRNDPLLIQTMDLLNAAQINEIFIRAAYFDNEKLLRKAKKFGATDLDWALDYAWEGRRQQLSTAYWTDWGAKNIASIGGSEMEGSTTHLKCIQLIKEWKAEGMEG